MTDNTNDPMNLIESVLTALFGIAVEKITAHGGGKCVIATSVDEKTGKCYVAIIQEEEWEEANEGPISES